MRPYDAEGTIEACRLSQGDFGACGFWIATDGYMVSIWEQRARGTLAQRTDVPRLIFNRLIDWYLQEQAQPKRVNRLKMRVECALVRGPESEDVRCFYSMVTSLLRCANVYTVGRAIEIVSAEMIRTDTIEREIGGRRLLIRRETLDEAMLALRWLRLYRPTIDMRALIEDMARGPRHRPTIHMLVAAE